MNRMSIVQDPSMFGAVISQVGVYDMLRYQLFTIGELQHLPQRSMSFCRCNFSQLL